MNDKIPVEKDSTQWKIVQAALDEFAEFGLHGARVDRIAENAGVNKAMIYYHFKSKENLYHKVLVTHIFEKINSVSEAMHEQKDLREVLVAATKAYLKIFLNNEQLRRLILRELADVDSPVFQMIADVIRESKIPLLVHNHLKRGIEKGKYREVDIQQALVSFITMNIGAYFLFPIFSKVYPVGTREEFFTRRAEAIVDLFLHGVVA